MTRRRRWEGGICWFVKFSPLSLSRFKKVGSRFGSAGVFGLVSRGPLAPVVPVLGIHGRPLFFPDFPRPWCSPIGALTLRRTNVDRPRSGEFQDQARMGLFVLPCGVFWASGTCGSMLGYHGRPLCFHGLSLILGFVFSVELGRHPYSLRMRLEGLAGGSCLSPPWGAAGSVKSPASLPQIHQVEGISQVSFPYQGRYSPATRPVAI
jgi:hypothetical protein